MKKEKSTVSSSQKLDSIEDHTNSQILSIVASAATANDSSSNGNVESKNTVKNVKTAENMKQVKSPFTPSLGRKIKQEDSSPSYSTKTVKPTTVPFKYQST